MSKTQNKMISNKSVNRILKSEQTAAGGQSSFTKY